MQFRIRFILLILCITPSIFAQQSLLPGLYKKFAISGEDTNRVNAGNDIGWELLSTNMDSAIIYTEQALKLSQKINWTKGIAFSYHQLGIIYYYKGDFNRSLQLYDKAITEWKQVPGYHGMNGMAGTYGNIGGVFTQQGNFSKALENDFNALRLCEKIGNKKGAATHYGNIGAIYAQQRDFDKALNSFFRALNICRQTNNQEGIENNFSNIGTVYLELLNHKEALKYLNQALELAEKRGDKSAVAPILDNIGSTYSNLNELDKAKTYFVRAIQFADESNNQITKMSVLEHLGNTYVELGNYNEGEKLIQQALKMSTGLGMLNIKKTQYRSLSELYAAKGDYKKSLEYYIKFSQIKDSLFNVEKLSELTRKEMNFEFDKREADIKQEQDKKDILATEEKKKQQLIIYAVSGGLFIMLVLALIIYRGYRQKQQANTIILQQKNEVEIQKEIAENQKKITEEKNKEITDSITYAKRLQNAILPSEQSIKKHLPENFILYKPKDIVAGDFYWMHCVQFDNLKMNLPIAIGIENEKKENDSNTILFAVADCTGHGVPGAMVSVVCSNALNRSVNEFSLTKPGEILDKTRELVLETFSKADEDVKDGMDITLVSINGTSVQWAGANNPLWYIKSKEFGEIKAHKQPIGKIENPSKFPTHSLELNKGDMLYLITDGFADQFGGAKGKKFKYQNLKEQLTSIHQKPLTEQQTILNTVFDTWQGELEQVDDVCVIGIKI